MNDYIESMMMTAFSYTCNMPDIDCNKNCKVCDSYLPNDFSPEKQLEMIKLIIDLNTTEIGFILHYKQHIEGKNFEQALAQLTTELMKAGELDKEKVKEILEE